MKTRMPPVFKIVERFILKHMKIVFYIKQVLKMAMQQIYLPMLYKRYAGKPVEKGLVIFADAHHEDLPFSMRKMYETLQGDPEYKNETWVTDFGKMGYGSLLKWLKQFMKRYAAAEYVFICDNFLPVSACTKRPETKVVQLWHSGGLLKKSGYDTTEDIPKMYKGDSVYKNYDLLTVSALCCVPVFRRCGLHRVLYRQPGSAVQTVIMMKRGIRQTVRNFTGNIQMQKGKKSSCGLRHFVEMQLCRRSVEWKKYREP